MKKCQKFETKYSDLLAAINSFHQKMNTLKRKYPYICFILPGETTFHERRGAGCWNPNPIRVIPTSQADRLSPQDAPDIPAASASAGAARSKGRPARYRGFQQGQFNESDCIN
jgi:hypothetical protein